MKAYSVFKYTLYFLIFILIFLPVIYIFISVSFPNSLWNYIIFFFDLKILTIFFKTLLLGLFVSIISGGIGFILAIILEYTDMPNKEIFRFLLFAPFLIPTYLFTFSWMGFLGKRGTFTDINFYNIPINIYNPLAVIIFLSLSFFPIAMFVISLGLKNIDENLIDSARLTNNKRIIRKIIFPLVKPHLLIACLFVFMLAISEYTVPAFLRVNTYSSEVFVQLAGFYDIRKALIYSLPLVIFAIFLTSFIHAYFKNKPFASIHSFYRKKKNFIILSKNQKIFSYIFIFLLLFSSLFIPIVMIVIESEMSFFDAIFSSKKQIFNSFLISIIASVIITFFGFFIYYFFKNKNFLITLISFPLAISSPVIGISLINLYNSFPIPIYGSILMVILGYILRFIPFSVLIFSSFFPQVSHSIEESAILAKADLFKRIKRIIIPLIKGGFLSSFIIIFILSFGEIGVTQMVSPPGFQTLSIRIETLMHYGNYSYVASLSILLLLLIFLVYIVYFLSYKKGE
jgi:iron(III) transport system permease protein